MPEFVKLLDGYKRYRSDAFTTQKERMGKLAHDGQHPEIMVITCADSRVLPSQVFDVDPGDIFTVRNVAALVPPFETSPGQHGVSAALEFAVHALEVRQIVVLGHRYCGGCKVALTQELQGTKPGEGGFIAQWISLLDAGRETVVAKYGSDGPAAELAMEQEAVRVSLQNLRTFPCVQRKLEAGTLKLRGTFLEIGEGELHVLDEETGEFSLA